MKFKSRARQNHDDPQPLPPRHKTERGGKQTAEELKNPPMRPAKNGGMLRSGGSNRGSTPSELRQKCRDALTITENFDVPVNVIKSKTASHSEKMKAWELLARFGGLSAVSLTDGDGNPMELPPFIVQIMDKEQVARSLGEGGDQPADPDADL